MTFKNNKTLLLRRRILGLIISYLASGALLGVQAEEVIFNSDVLDLNDKKNIDLGQFSRGDFIMPGKYAMTVRINKMGIPDQMVPFYVPEKDPEGSEACISPELVKQFGLKEGIAKKITWWHDNECVVASSLPGMVVRGDLPSTTLYVNIPQAYLEYSDDNWDPPSRWDEGIPGILLDYNVNSQLQRQQKDGVKTANVSGNGVVGANLGAWRLRADWQARYNRQTGGRNHSSETDWDWSRYYAYRALPSLGAKLTFGENYLYSDIFDGFRFAGISLKTDDSMLPPNLRGYAPEVTGVARTNAKVVISQQGRVLKETQVASGPFRIQDLNDAVSGMLDVRVEEQDGTLQKFQVNTASIPYLTRPGMVRYKIASGRPSDMQHHTDGPLFTSGEFSWGINNGWSLYGGAVITGKEYNALSLGIGRDLLAFGAISFDATQSRAKLPHDGETLSGGSYRVNYSKRFDETDSQVTFAGYRFSQKNYMSMSDYLEARRSGIQTNNSKELYTVSLSQNFSDWRLSAFLTYNHQTYWDRPDNDRYEMTLSKIFDLWKFRDISLSLTAFRNKYYGANDDGAYVSLSIPFGQTGTLGYNSSWNKNDTTNQASYYDRINNNNNYQVNAGNSRSGARVGGSVNHTGNIADVYASVDYNENNYSALAMSLHGGFTGTTKGAALHPASIVGSTRMLLDTNGVSGIPIHGYGPTVTSNYFGTAVVSDVSNYYRSQVSIDVNNLPENAEAKNSVVTATLTEGAIGYRRFDIISGEKAMAIIKMADGTTPPFGAVVFNKEKQRVGIVGDDGNTYLTGINPDEKMTVNFNGKP